MRLALVDPHQPEFATALPELIVIIGHARGPFFAPSLEAPQLFTSRC